MMILWETKDFKTGYQLQLLKEPGTQLPYYFQITDPNGTVKAAFNIAAEKLGDLAAFVLINT